MVGELIINGIKIDITEKVPFPITYSTADVKNPTKRKRTASKTVRLPGTKNNLLFFSSAYQLSIADPKKIGVGFDFDPTLQYPAQYLQNGSPIFNGAMRLLKVISKKGVVSFDISLYSTAVSMDKQWGNLTVAELGWSEYDHTLNQTTVQASWAATPGTGYLYGLINYGFNTNALTNEFKTNELIPHVYKWEVLKKAFEYLGLTIDSTILNTTDFKKRTWGTGNGKVFQLDATEISNRLVDLDFKNEYTGTTKTPYLTVPHIDFSGSTLYIYYQGFNYETINNIAWGDYTINDDDYNQVGDYGGVNPDLDGVYTIANAGTYRIKFICPSMDLILIHNGTASEGALLKCKYKFIVYKNGANIGEQNFESETDLLNYTQNVAIDITTDTHCNPGDIITLGLFTNINGSRVVETLALYSGGYSLDAFADTGGAQNISLTIECINKSLTDGDTVEIARYLPGVRVNDWFNDLVKTFNLYVSEPDVDGVVSIENFNTYYHGSQVAKDWTHKIDYSQNIEIDPPLIKAKNYLFEFAEDNGYLNELYKNEYGKGYGNYNYEINSPLSTATEVWKVHFAQSVPYEILAADGTNDALIIPLILQIDKETNLAKTYEGKPRVFYYNGLQDCVAWKLLDSNGANAITLNEYPQMHHLNSLTAPTFDLNFGKPDFLQYQATTYTNKNIVQEYYVPYLTELTDKSAKTLNAYFDINEFDLKGDFLRYLVNIDGVLFRINIVKDYDGNGHEITKVELNRVIEGRKPNTAGLGHGTPNTPDLSEAIILTGGWQTYADKDTATTPISIPGTGVKTTLTNDGEKSGTNKDYSPAGVSDLWNVETSEFDFNDLEIGDTVTIRINIEVTTTAANQSYGIDLIMRDSHETEYPINFINNTEKTIGTYNVSIENRIFLIDSLDIETEAKLKMFSDAAANVEIIDWGIEVHKFDK